MQVLQSICERVTPYGIFEIWIKRRGSRNFMFECLIKNLIPTIGKAALANIQIGAGTAASHIAIGTGVLAAADADTTLGTEVLRMAATRSRITTTTLNDTANYTADIAIGTSYTISEAGLLNAASAGDLYARQVFTGVVVISGDYFRAVWKFIN
jgi:hypothetical protein